jgi:LmbE family N-acetylglucosaminyl deacetylase
VPPPVTAEVIGRELEPPPRALAIGAHPDDVEFGCGGTIAKWSAAGTVVDLCVLTDGSKGTWDPEADLGALVAARRIEQRAAADELGIRDIHFLDLVDGELQSGRAEQAAVCEVIRRVRPDVILGHDPWKRYRLHPDHLHAGRLTVDAIVAARDPHFFPERGAAHRPSDLLLYEADVVDHVEDISGSVDRKIAALLAHRSQWRSTLGIDPGAPDADAQRRAFEERIRDDAGRGGAAAGIQLGEAFKRIDEL